MQRTAPTGRKLALGLALLLLACAAILLGRLPGGSEAAAKPEAHASGAITYKQKTFNISGANAKRRLMVRCPGSLVPLGGGHDQLPATGAPTARVSTPTPTSGSESSTATTAPSSSSTPHRAARRRATSPCRSPVRASRSTSPLPTRPSTSTRDRPRPPSRPARGREASVRGRLPADRLHRPRRRLHHRVSRDLRQVMERHRAGLRPVRRRAHRDRLLLAKQEAAPHRGLRLGPRGGRQVRHGDDATLPGRPSGLRRLQQLPNRLDPAHQRRDQRGRQLVGLRR